MGSVALMGTVTAAVPHDQHAESDTIGAMILNADALRVGLEQGNAADFYDQFYANVFACLGTMHRRGAGVDVHTVAAEYEMSLGTCDVSRLLEATANVPSVSNIRQYVSVVARHATARRIMGLCAETTAAMGKLQDPYEAGEALKAELSMLDVPVDQSVAEAQTMDDLLETAEEAAPWVVPGMIREDWRVLLVAGEGMGKSVILRQVAMLAAQGIHPFRFSPIPPVRTLIIDLENPVASVAETGGRMVRRLRHQKGEEYDPTRCRIFRRPGGIDPRTRHDRGELEREIAAQRPELVCIGPAYKMLHRRAQKGGMESHEEATDPVLQILDDLRTRFKFGLMIEHHAPQGYGAQRDMRPYGSQRWLAWPEIGLSLKADPQQRNTWDLGRHRGDRMTTDWPVSLHRGQVWPWEATFVTHQRDTVTEQEEPF